MNLLIELLAAGLISGVSYLFSDTVTDILEDTLTRDVFLRGYKFDNRKIREEYEEYSDQFKTQEDIISDRFDKAIKYVPVFNVINAVLKANYYFSCRDEIISYYDMGGFLVELTDVEKENFMEKPTIKNAAELQLRYDVHVSLFGKPDDVNYGREYCDFEFESKVCRKDEIEESESSDIQSEEIEKGLRKKISKEQLLEIKAELKELDDSEDSDTNCDWFGNFHPDIPIANDKTKDDIKKLRK